MTRERGLTLYEWTVASLQTATHQPEVRYKNQSDKNQKVLLIYNNLLGPSCGVSTARCRGVSPVGEEGHFRAPRAGPGAEHAAVHQLISSSGSQS